MAKSEKLKYNKKNVKNQFDLKKEHNAEKITLLNDKIIEKNSIELTEWFKNLNSFNLDYRLESSHYINYIVNTIRNHQYNNTSPEKNIILMYSVLEYLATEGPATTYRIFKKFNISISNITNAISKLEMLGFIRIINKNKWRTGLQRKEYNITSVGLAPILILYKERIFSKIIIDEYPSIQKWFDENIKHTYLKLIIEKNSNLPLYDIFFNNWKLICNEELEYQFKDLFSNEVLSGAFKKIELDIRQFLDNYFDPSEGDIDYYSMHEDLARLKQYITFDFFYDIITCNNYYYRDEISRLDNFIRILKILNQTTNGLILFNKWKDIFYEIIILKKSYTKDTLENIDKILLFF